MPDIKELSDFDIAEQVAAAASWIDENKPKHLGGDHVEAVRHSAFLHDLAQHLAGDRVLELYSEE